MLTYPDASQLAGLNDEILNNAINRPIKNPIDTDIRKILSVVSSPNINIGYELTIISLKTATHNIPFPSSFL